LILYFDQYSYFSMFITSQNQLSDVMSAQIAVILFVAKWDRASRKLDLTEYDTMCKKIQELKFGVVDVEQFEEEAIQLGVSQLPTLIFLKQRSIWKSLSSPTINEFQKMFKEFISSETHQYSIDIAPNNSYLNQLVAQILSRDTPLMVFVAGEKSQAGKSSVCLGLLGSLLRLGFRNSDISYIKPATQCEQPQLIWQFCQSNSIDCEGIGPVVFYQGFTREFLKGNLGTRSYWLNEVKLAVNKISRGKKFVIIDGVGYPAVGSICQLSNADIAEWLQIPVLIVGKSGVGDAVDSFNLNANFFESRGICVLGGIFNKLQLTGYYSLENCREAVTSYFTKFRSNQKAYGFIPQIDFSDVQTQLRDNTNDNIMNKEDFLKAKLLIDTFMDYVHIDQIMFDILQYFETKGVVTENCQIQAQDFSPQSVLSKVDSHLNQNKKRPRIIDENEQVCDSNMSQPFDFKMKRAKLQHKEETSGG